jgi:predicted RNase H-like HicB family nuclease
VDCRPNLLFEPAEEEGFIGTCPALPGLVTGGDTLEAGERRSPCAAA